MSNYNPFKKPISKLEAKDLEVLKDISEGWYIEYKSSLPKNDKIAKSITSFANTLGGWLFYGVKEKESDSREAGEFCGIDNPEEAEVHVREAIVYYSNPEAFFETKIIYGGCDEIGLPDNKAVLVIYIPQSNSLPHIHGSGRVYRRISDSSEPMVEKDRSRLDAMWEQKRNNHEKLKEFLNTAPLQSSAESPILHLFLMTDPLGTRGHRSSMSFDVFNEVIKSTPFIFDNFYSGPNRFVARCTKGNDVNSDLLTWQYFANGTSVVSIPLNVCNLCNNNYDANKSFLDGYEWGEHFLNLLDTNGLNQGKIIDLNQLVMLFQHILTIHSGLLLKDEIQGQLFIKVISKNMNKAIPFIDFESFIDFILKCGVPLPLHDDWIFPEGKDINLFYTHKDGLNFEGGTLDYINAITLFTSMMNCFALPATSLFKEGETVKEASIRLVQEFSEIFKRSPRTTIIND